MTVQGRWGKLKSRVDSGGVGALPLWLVRWLYWEAELHRAVPPSTLKRWRLACKSFLPRKKYGISDPIIVFQMGKVGSTSVFRSLEALDLDVPVYHLHFLNYLDGIEEWSRQAMGDDSGAVRIVQAGRRVRREMERSPRRKWNLICLVRTPITRGISNFFHHLDTTIPSFRERLTHNELKASELVDYFVNHYRDDTPLQWFDQQIKDLFGIDVYATEFPKGRGYAIYEKGNIRLLVIRLENLNQCAASAIYEFLNVPSFRPMTANVTEQKEYAALYREFGNVLRLPREYVEHWHQSRYARHFYSPEELAESVKRWV